MNRIFFIVCLSLGCASEAPATVADLADAEVVADAALEEDTALEPTNSAADDTSTDTGRPDTGAADSGSTADTATVDAAIADTVTVDSAKPDTATADTPGDGAAIYTTEFPLCATLDMCSSYRADSGALILKSGESAGGPRTPPFNPSRIQLDLRLSNGSTTCTGQLSISIRSASTGYAVSGTTPVFAGGDTNYTMVLTRPATAPLLVPPLKITVTRFTTPAACASIPIQLRKSPVTFE